MSDDLAAKMAKLRPLYDALDRAIVANLKEKSYASASYVQQLQQQIAGLRKTLPPLRLAAG